MDLRTRTRIIDPLRQIAWFVAMFAGYVLMPAGLSVSIFLSLLGAVLIGAGIWALVRASRFRDGTLVHIDEQGIALDGAIALPRATIRQAYYVPTGAHVVVRGKKHLTITVSGEPQAEAILEALHMDVAARTAEFGAVAPNLLPMFGTMFTGLGLVGIASAMQMIPLLVLGVLFALLGPILFVPAKIQVGVDGVLLKARVGTRFYPYADIDHVVPASNGVILRLKNETDVKLPLVTNRKLGKLSEQERDALLERINTAMQRRGPAAAAASVLWQLTRGGKPVSAWLAALEGESFRSAPLRNDDLVAVLDDQNGASAATRVAAAVVLARRGESARVRIAADASAEPKLRVALETIASGETDDARLDEVMRRAAG